MHVGVWTSVIAVGFGEIALLTRPKKYKRFQFYSRNHLDTYAHYMIITINVPFAIRIINISPQKTETIKYTLLHMFIVIMFQ